MTIFVSRPFRFLCVGLLVSVIDTGLTWLLIVLTGTRILAVTAGFIAGLIASYLLHATISFTVALAPKHQIPRFLGLVSINYLETIGIVLLATETGFSAMTGKLASLPVVACSSYLLSRHWVYAARAPGDLHNAQ
jgi:putative flippase GtrA